MTKFPELWAALAAPIPREQVKTRAGGRGQQLSYITARTVMNRLDSVVGPENWTERYYLVGDVLFCDLTITLPDGSTVTKADAGGFKVMTERDRATGQLVTDEENTDKTGPSDAFKRAAVKFGIGRELYQDGVASFQPIALKRAMPPGPGPEGDKKAEAWLAKTVAHINATFADRFTKEFGRLPTRDLMTGFQLKGHILKWATQNGLVEERPEGWNNNHGVRALASLLESPVHGSDLLNEADRYAEACEDAAFASARKPTANAKGREPGEDG